MFIIETHHNTGGWQLWFICDRIASEIYSRTVNTDPKTISRGEVGPCLGMLGVVCDESKPVGSYGEAGARTFFQFFVIIRSYVISQNYIYFCLYTVCSISFEPRLPKSILVAPSTQNFGYSFLKPPHYIPNFKLIGSCSYVALYHDLLSV